MPRFKERAICIRWIDWSETSQIVALMTEHRGKVRGVAKGSKRMSPSAVARFSGGIELLTGGEALGQIKASAELANITEWDLQKPHRHLRQDLDAQRRGLYAADLVNALLAEHDPHPRVYRALDGLLEGLAERGGRGEKLLRFQWRLLEDCGYRPQLEEDVRGRGALADRRTYQFDAVAGGLTQRGAGASSPLRGPWRVRRQTVELLRQVASEIDDGAVGPADGAGAGRDRGRFDPATVDRANRLLCVYIRSIIERELPTMKVVIGKEARRHEGR